MKLRTCICVLIIASILSGGCVRRRLTVRSNPPGATVYIDDQEIGETPVSTPFVYYGTRKIQLVKDGFETLTVKQKFSPPWYEVPPLDFFAENVYPGELRDERIVDFEMEPQRVVPIPEILERAQQLRDATRAGYTIPTPEQVRRAQEEGSSSVPYIPPPFPAR